VYKKRRQDVNVVARGKETQKVQGKSCGVEMYILFVGRGEEKKQVKDSVRYNQRQHHKDGKQ
jgi:hypothetical protein